MGEGPRKENIIDMAEGSDMIALAMKEVPVHACRPSSQSTT